MFCLQLTNCALNLNVYGFCCNVKPNVCTVMYKQQKYTIYKLLLVNSQQLSSYAFSDVLLHQ